MKMFAFKLPASALIGQMQKKYNPSNVIHLMQGQKKFPFSDEFANAKLRKLKIPLM
jgi:hypothetical protein